MIGKAGMFTMVLSFIMALFPMLASTAGARAEDVSSAEELMVSMGISRVAEKVKAPDFVLKDLEGNKIRLSDHRAKVVMVHFWTTW